MDNTILKTNNNEYLYFINYEPQFEKDLCMLEMKSFFKKLPTNKHLFSDIFINPSRSGFIKEMISIIYKEDSLEKIVANIKNHHLCYDKFKIHYIKLDSDKISYKERMDSLKKTGYVITGSPDMHNPEICLGLIKINNQWIFGEYHKNDFEYHIHDRKPYSYSNALSSKLARTLVNIAVQNNTNIKLIDPCCGIGTVVIEALSMDLNITGYEINENIAQNAQRNLEFFGYDNVITCGDMHNISEHYDSAIIDIPYGLFSPTTHENQIAIIQTARRISDKLILVAFEDMSQDLTNAHFKIIEKCSTKKGSFTRYIFICK